MAEVITRALLERYLRATGWRWRARPHACPVWERGQDAVPATWLEGGMQDAAIGSLTIAEKAPRQEIGFRLGLCAAAEDLREDADGYEVASADAPGPREALLEAAERLLAMAGVDPKRWNETRRMA